jgi:hypothetical protein
MTGKVLDIDYTAGLLYKFREPMAFAYGKNSHCGSWFLRCGPRPANCSAQRSSNTGRGPEEPHCRQLSHGTPPTDRSDGPCVWAAYFQYVKRHCVGLRSTVRSLCSQSKPCKGRDRSRHLFAPDQPVTINQLFQRTFNPREAEAIVEPAHFEEQALKLTGRSCKKPSFGVTP